MQSKNNAVSDAGVTVIRFDLVAGVPQRVLAMLQAAGDPAKLELDPEHGVGVLVLPDACLARALRAVAGCP